MLCLLQMGLMNVLGSLLGQTSILTSICHHLGWLADTDPCADIPASPPSLRLGVYGD